MRQLSLLGLAALALLAVSCENTSGPRFEGDVYTLAGLLVAGSAVSLENPIYVTRSTSIDSFDPLQIFVFDASVILRDLDTGQDFALEPALHEFKIKYIDPAEHLIQPLHRYRIEVQVPGYDSLITAETTVPQSVSLLPDPWDNQPANTGYTFAPDSLTTTPYSQIDALYPLVIGTGETAGNFNFFGEIYCLEEFSTDLEFTTQVFGIEHPDESLRDIYNADGAFRRVNFLFPARSGPLEGLQGNYLLLTDYAYAFALYGRYRVKAWVVDDNYYRYVYMEEGYLHGGVQNALGYFGSASGGTLYIKIGK